MSPIKPLVVGHGLWTVTPRAVRWTGWLGLALLPVCLSGDLSPAPLAQAQTTGRAPVISVLTDNPWIRVGLTTRACKLRAIGKSTLRIVWENSNVQVLTDQPWEIELPSAPTDEARPNQRVERATGEKEPRRGSASPEAGTGPSSPVQGSPSLPVRLQTPRGHGTELYVENSDGSLLRGSYRGFLRVVKNADGRGLTVINVLPLEDYLLGVVGREMPAASPAEALKAQAIVARSYALAHLGKHDGSGFDLCASEDCQVYGGMAAEGPAISAALQATRGMVLAAEGQPISGFYSANCGGQTEDPDNVWGGPAPAHRPVADWTDETVRDLAKEDALRRFLINAPPAYCQGVAGFRWRRRFDRALLEAWLKPNVESLLGRSSQKFAPVTGLKVEGRTRSGRAQAVVVEAAGVAYRVEGEAIRSLLRPPKGARLDGPDAFLFSSGLPSRTFAVDRATGPDGLPTAFEIFGSGWGHGTGMCQWGAIGMARRGLNCDRILAHYYPGASIFASR